MEVVWFRNAGLLFCVLSTASASVSIELEQHARGVRVESDSAYHKSSVASHTQHRCLPVTNMYTHVHTQPHALSESD